MASETPCTACSWTPDRQDGCRYHSNVKLFHGCSDRGIWSIGSRLILKERSNKIPYPEGRNVRFVKENTSIPAPTIIEEWEEDNGRCFTLQTRVPGKPLSEIWSTMTDEEKDRVAKQTADYLHELHELKSPRMEGLGGRPMCSNLLFGGIDGAPHGPCSSDDELWAEMEKSLSTVPEKVRQRLREKLPTAAPYTFTHGDMTYGNIIVENGNLSGIVDWEMSGYYPVWWETTDVLICEGPEDQEWKRLLLKYMPGNPDAHDFFLDFYYVGKHSYLNSERGRKLLEDLD